MAIFHMDVADNTVALVTKHCGLQLELYQKCVTQNPENWDIKCITQKRALAKCSEDNYESDTEVIYCVNKVIEVRHLIRMNVPIIKHVKEMCDPFIKDYDACVMKNQQDPTICLDSLKRLFHCTEEHGKLPPSGPPRVVKEEADKPTASGYGYRGGA